MTANAYRHRLTGAVVAVTEGTYLEDVIVGSNAYEPAELDELATTEPALGDTAISGDVADRDEHDGGWLTPPGVPPAPIAGAVPGVPAAPASSPSVLDAAYEVDTVEGVNGYLDDHPEAAEAVLAYERDHKGRAGILEGRHAPDGRHAAPAGE